MMNGSSVSVIILIGIALYFIERKNFKEKKKLSTMFYALVIISISLAVTLAVFPNMPGLTQAVDRWFEPIGKLLK